jgi:arginyl-tRNA--protein-N-Asp/Glu arginylyltransferase
MMKFGLTQQFPCSYLADKDERLLVFVGDNASIESSYGQLIDSGFRRSGEQIYRPHCPNCNACQSVRVLVEEFVPSRGQKRVQKRNDDIEIKISHENKASYYPLYESYINHRHADGSMFPANIEQYLGFVSAKWHTPLFIEFYLLQKLIAVAVTDDMPNGLSALYTFFHPDMSERSIGTFAILSQIQQARSLNKQYLYLGYQVDACAKMNYKIKFLPYERFFANKWHQFTKNVG